MYSTPATYVTTSTSRSPLLPEIELRASASVQNPTNFFPAAIYWLAMVSALHHATPRYSTSPAPARHTVTVPPLSPLDPLLLATRVRVHVTGAPLSGCRAGQSVVAYQHCSSSSSPHHQVRLFLLGSDVR